MKTIDLNTPVIVEWYTFERFPRVHHALIMTYANALDWQRKGIQIVFGKVDPLLYPEFPPPKPDKPQ